MSTPIHGKVEPGFEPVYNAFDLGQSKQSFGHTGMGGSIGLADPANRFAFGYVMNKMGSGGLLAPLTATFASLLKHRNA